MAFDGNNFKGPNGVNVVALLQLAEVVEKSDDFDMSRVTHGCGTPACIMGHAMTRGERKGSVKRAEGYTFSTRAFNRVRNLLGLSCEQADDLFMPNGWQWGGEFSNAHGAAVLRNLAATGEVDWPGTKPK